MDNNDLGRVPAGQALAVPVEPASRLAASRCDPSRKYRFFISWAVEKGREMQGEKLTPAQRYARFIDSKADGDWL